MDVALVAIAAFHPAAILGDRQPDARMARGAAAAITGDFPFRNDFSLGDGGCHRGFPALDGAAQGRLFGAYDNDSEGGGKASGAKPRAVSA